MIETPDGGLIERLPEAPAAEWHCPLALHGCDLFPGCPPRVRLGMPLVARSRDLLVRVPAGFLSDGASVPRFFWRVWPAWGPYGPAAVVHDWLYVVRRTTRLEADEAFVDLMEYLGVEWATRRAFWLAVRHANGEDGWPAATSASSA